MVGGHAGPVIVLVDHWNICGAAVSIADGPLLPADSAHGIASDPLHPLFLDGMVA